MNTFLERRSFLLLFLLNLILYLYAPSWSFYLSLVLSFYFIYLFRNPGPLYKDNFKHPPNIYLSPVFGEIKQIRHNVSHVFWGKELVEVHITAPRRGPMGLYLPINCEVMEVSKKKKAQFWRYFRETDPRKEIYLPDQSLESLAGTMVRLKSIQGQMFGIQIVKNIKDFWPRIWVRPGDKGRAGACFGHFPFGGTVLLYLPKDSEILTKKDALLVAGETTLAAKL